ncbi:Chaperone protein HscA [Buchnera aphidicola (Cinara kochiana kochiana)]|uniref:Chaperone protein HscA, partial n=1 Tax=Buchnera aphidicola (Cinara kochiana kochiana) TaxID=2518976 RepID=A0A451D6A4_9GAMM|nr:Hsp70 family protein [Buchnera aphidicola]VFP81295.1 Chaperone protein HscA [Buchnera aphidicola (Cinara kochiana kochiana)]
MNNKNEKKKIVIGIDFGTTYCLVSTKKNKKIQTIEAFNKKNFFPTIIHFGKKKTSIGWKAQKFLKTDTKNTVTSIKRFIGISYSELKKKKLNILNIISKSSKKELIFKTNIGKIPVSLIIQKIFKYIKKKIEKKLKKNIYGTVITIPAYFNNIQKNIIRKSAQASQLKVLRLLNEPTAAAIAYGLEKKRKGLMCIYDLGGGTFDVSILKVYKGIFEVLSTEGDNKLGGDDFDYLLAYFLYSKLKNQPKLNHNLFKKLLIIAEKVKIQLSQKSQIKIKLSNEKINCSVLEFNTLIHPYIQKTLKILNSALQYADIKISDIDDIILVGGSTYIPLIRQQIFSLFKQEPLISINPIEAVAQGAGLHASFLFYKKQEKNQSMLLLDVIPISIGIELLGGLMEKMIEKNTKIPTEVMKIFTTFKDYQTGFCINIFQGEDKYVRNCKLLKKFKIQGLPSKLAGQIKIITIFRINVDGQLSIIIQEKLSKINYSIKIDPLYQ